MRVVLLLTGRGTGARLTAYESARRFGLQQTR